MSPWSSEVISETKQLPSRTGKKEMAKLYHPPWLPASSLGVSWGSTHREVNDKCTSPLNNKGLVRILEIQPIIVNCEPKKINSQNRGVCLNQRKSECLLKLVKFATYRLLEIPYFSLCAERFATFHKFSNPRVQVPVTLFVGTLGGGIWTLRLVKMSD